MSFIIQKDMANTIPRMLYMSLIVPLECGKQAIAWYISSV